MALQFAQLGGRLHDCAGPFCPAVRPPRWLPAAAGWPTSRV